MTSYHETVGFLDWAVPVVTPEHPTIKPFGVLRDADQLTAHGFTIGGERDTTNLVVSVTDGAWTGDVISIYAVDPSGAGVDYSSALFTIDMNTVDTTGTDVYAPGDDGGTSVAKTLDVTAALVPGKYVWEFTSGVPGGSLSFGIGVRY